MFRFICGFFRATTWVVDDKANATLAFVRKLVCVQFPLVTKKSTHENSCNSNLPELIVGRLEAGCNGDVVEEEGEEEMQEPSFDHHQSPILLLCGSK